MHPAFADNGFTGMRLGRLPAVNDPRTLQLADYLDETALPPVPATFDLGSAVHRWPMYGNDTLGDCTCAAAGHMIQAWTKAHGRTRTPATTTIVKGYWATGDGADTGRVETDVLNYWRQHGFGTHRIGAYVQVNPKNLDHLRAAVYLFGGVYTGVALPVTAQHQPIWDVVPGPGSGAGSWGGHAIPYVAYDATSFTCVTWGATLKLTTGFHLAYTDEVYAILSPDWVNGGPSPAGFDLAALTADLAAVSR